MAGGRRRQFLFAAVGLGVARLARAQALRGPPGTERVRRIGGLFGGSSGTHAKALEVLRDGLREHGWVEGRDVTFDLRWAEGHMDRLPALVEALVRSRPDVIVTAANNVIVHLKKATSAIPIVMAAGADPVEWGLVESLSRPGGNLTGLTGFYEAMPVKMLELVRALVPGGSRVVALLQPGTPTSRAGYREAFARAARDLDLRVEVVETAAPEDVRRAVTRIAMDRPAALLVLPGSMFFALGAGLVGDTGSLGIPVIYPFEENAEAGGLMSYAPDLMANYRRAAFYVDRILRGARPGDLPIEQPTRLSLAVNLRTANALGIRVPREILLRADRVIE